MRRACGTMGVLVAIVVAACGAPSSIVSPPAGSAVDAAGTARSAAPASPAVDARQTAGLVGSDTVTGGPPAATIAVEGGDPVDGLLGTYTWMDAGSDAPWLDGNPIHVGAGETLTGMLAMPVGIDGWTVRRVTPGDRDGTGAVGMAEGSGEPIRFPAPPSGSWSVLVEVRFADNLGSASYHWLFDVD